MKGLSTAVSAAPGHGLHQSPTAFVWHCALQLTQISPHPALDR